MTHSLHRRGKPASLKNDFVVLATPAIGINDKDSKSKLRRILRIMESNQLNNVGDCINGSIYSGNTLEQIEENLKDGGRVRAAFSNEEGVRRLLTQLKAENFGLSITVSGLLDRTLRMSKEVELKPHSVNLSLNVWGNKSILPPENILEITTMCGHHLISTRLVEKYIALVAKGMPARKAIEKIARPCVCGIFNTDRAEQLLAACASEYAAARMKPDTSNVKLLN